MTYLYLATPYSKYPLGLGRAFDLAVRTRGFLLQNGINTFSPIIHSHPVAMACGIDPLDHSIWLPAEEPIMRKACGLIMLMADSWEQSYGMGKEKEWFEAQGRPVYWMTPGEVPKELLRGTV